MFVNRRWGHIPGSRLIVPSLPLSLRAGRQDWGRGPPGLGDGEVQTPGVRKCKHLLSRAECPPLTAKKPLKLDMQKAPAIPTPRSQDSLADPFPAVLLLLFLCAPGLTFLRGAFGSKNPLLSASAPLRAEKHRQTPIISRKVRKSIRGSLGKRTPAAACPAFIPDLFQESQLWGESLEGEGEKRIRKIKPAAGGFCLRSCACALGVWVFVSGRAI